MLYPKKITAKTYEELLQESLRKIPVYSGEWTNYHPADPGITTLENLTALQIIQQNHIEEIPIAVRRKLLELVGYRQKSGESAEIWLEAEGVLEGIDLPAGERFLAGDISFETTRRVRLGAGRITGVFSRSAGVTADLSYVLDRNVMFGAKIFGDDVLEGASLWLVMDEAPQEGEEMVVYAAVGGKEGRTPFSEGKEVSFAEICWECHTEEGFVPMQAEDGTHGFLADGCLRLTQPGGYRAVRVEEDGISGYVWRARLIHGEYDKPPVLTYLSGFLFPAVQKETMAVTYAFQRSSNVVVRETMPENGYMRVYAREQKGGSYRVYGESTSEGDRGRYYRKKKLDQGNYAIVFDQKRFGFAPGRFRDAVKIVVYSEKIMRNYGLGSVFGYDGQQIRLPGKHVVVSDFSVIAERKTQNGEKIYDFLLPGRQDGQDMYYSLFEDEGKLVIHDPGIYVGAKLYLGGIAVTRGPEGNVRADNVLVPAKPVCGPGIRFRNPAQGRGGRFRESFEEMRRRFVKDLGRAETAVTLADYEALVRRLPGLCIHKVHAWMDSKKNEVQIAVLPGSGERFPKLSGKYLQMITNELESKRLLSTGIRVRQPVYAPVMISGTIYVKPHYDDCGEQIEAAAREAIDYVHGVMAFGERLRFDRVFHVINDLDCVAYIHELALSPQNAANVMTDGTDIIPAPDCLLYPGDCRLVILPQTDSRQEGGQIR